MLSGVSPSTSQSSARASETWLPSRSSTMPATSPSRPAYPYLLSGSDLLDDLASALTAAEVIGYPVMMKTAAGGGGIGMYSVWNAEELSRRFDESCKKGARCFGQAGVFVAVIIAQARDIEVQIFGDGQG